MTAKTKRFELRATEEEMARIRAAVEMGNERSITEFMLDSALAAAELRLMDRTQFALADKDFNAFIDALNRPVQHKPRLRRLLNDPSVLEGRSS